MKRRSFILNSALLVAGLPLIPSLFKNALGASPEFFTGKYPILQGATNETSIQINIIINPDEKISAHLELNNQKISPAITRLVSYNGSPYAILKLTFKNLSLATYHLNVVSESGSLLDQRVVKTLDTKKRNGKYAIISCSSDYYPQDDEQMWTELAGAGPEVIFSIGDNVYADAEEQEDGESRPDVIWRRYGEHFTSFTIHRMKTLIPFIVTWDNHDYGENEGDSTFPYKKEAAHTLNSFFAQEEVPGFLEKGPGVSSLVHLFGQRFFLMDNRTWRSPKGESSQNETHWGVQQEKWLTAHLNDSAVPAWIMNGSQFFGAYAFFATRRIA